jgi:hypothetical protein
MRRSPAVLATRLSVLGLAGILIAGGAFAATSIFELNLELPPVAIFLPLALAAGGSAVLTNCFRAGWHVPQRPQALLATMLAVYCLIVTVGLPTLQRTRPTALAGRVVRQITPPDVPVGIYRLENWRASLRYYAERPLARLSTVEEASAFIARGPASILMIRRDYRELRQRGLPLTEVFHCRAVVGTVKSRSGLRRQQWDDLVLVSNQPRRRPLALP